MILTRRTVPWAMTAATLLLGVPAGAVAQEIDGYRLLGARVRVVTAPAARPLVGEVVAMNGDSIQIARPTGEVSALSFSAITRLERSAGQVSRTGKGLAWGAGIGLLAGAIGGNVLADGLSEGPDTGDGRAMLVLGVWV